MRYEIRLNGEKPSLVDHADFDGAMKWLILKAAEYSNVTWIHMGVAGIVIRILINDDLCYDLIEFSFPKKS